MTYLSLFAPLRRHLSCEKFLEGILASPSSRHSPYRSASAVCFCSSALSSYRLFLSSAASRSAGVQRDRLALSIKIVVS